MKLKNIAKYFLIIPLIFSCTSLPDQRSLEKNLTPPQIIPSVKTWKGGYGFYNVKTNTNVFYDNTLLKAPIDVFISDIKDLSDITLTPHTGQRSGSGGIHINLVENGDTRSGSYRIEIGDTLTVTAGDIRGIAYALTSIKQMIILNPDGMIPKGIIDDYPTLEVRGIMLDVGRRPFSFTSLQSYLRFIAFYKMSELHLHLSDNQLMLGDGVTGADWREDTWVTDAYAGFRVVLDPTPQFPSLWEITSKDLYYTKEQMLELKALAESLGVRIVGEIESPAHALSLTRIYSDLRKKDLKPDHVDLGNPKFHALIKEIWAQLSPLFHAVHLGADEYAGHKLSKELSEQMTYYINDTASFLKTLGQNDIRVWGNKSTLYDNGASQDPSITQQIWYNGYGDPEQSYLQGSTLINTNHEFYIVPAGTIGAAYWDMIPPAVLYEEFMPNVFAGGWTIDMHDPQFRGTIIANWNDMGWNPQWHYGDDKLHARLASFVKITAEKTWDGQTDKRPFEQFLDTAYLLGDGPRFDIGFSPRKGDLAPHKPIRASSYQDVISTEDSKDQNIARIHINFMGHPGGANDYMEETRWISEKSPEDQWLSVDLLKPHRVSRVFISWETMPESVFIHYSQDGLSWSDVKNPTRKSNGEITFDPVNAAYVRLYIKNNTKEEDQYQVKSFEIYQE